MRYFFLTLGVYLTLSTNAWSKELIKVDVIECQRVNSSAAGFKSQKGFESWFPKETRIFNSPDNEFTLLDGWGFDENKTNAEVKNSISKFKIRSSTITIDLNENSTKLFRYMSTPGYRATAPITYKCKKNGNTSIDIDQIRKVFR